MAIGCVVDGVKVGVENTGGQWRRPVCEYLTTPYKRSACKVSVHDEDDRTRTNVEGEDRAILCT